MLSHFVTRRRQPFADGHKFGSAGAYEIVAGEAHGEVAPEDPRNACIVNLAKSPRNERGAVEYRCDVHILRPKDMNKGNRRVLYEAPNRGSKRGLMFLNDAPECNDPVALEHAGNGFLMRHGYTWVTSGCRGISCPGRTAWCWTSPSPRTANSLSGGAFASISASIAPGVYSQPLSGDPRVQSYAAATLDTSEAELTVRMRSYGEREVVPSTEWRLPSWTPGPAMDQRRSDPALRISTYREDSSRAPSTSWCTRPRARWCGPGLRSRPGSGVVPALRTEGRRRQPQPPVGRNGYRKNLCLGPVPKRPVPAGLGIPGFQRGRARPAGVRRHRPHASGGGRMFLNYEFARPVTSCQQHTNQLEPELFPFAYNVLEDPQTGRKDGILKRSATDPLVIHTQTSTEYWQKRGSLAHTDGRGNDVPLPDRVRMYLMASTQHNAPYGTQAARGKTRHPNNPLPIGPALRALIVAMDRWATDGTAPPPSRIPGNADGTQVNPESLRTGFPAIPGAGCTGLHNRQLFLDYGEGAARGVIGGPPEAAARRRRLHHPRARGGRRRQRRPRNPPPLDHRPARHLHRMESPVQGAGRRRTGGPAGLFHPLRSDPG